MIIAGKRDGMWILYPNCGLPIRDIICGTRRVVSSLDARRHRVVCATCSAGGTFPHRTRNDATAAAVRDSNKPCRACGAS